MGEIWDDVLSTTKERELLKAAVNASKELCVTEHKKEHPTECPECWPRIINRMRDRYLNSSNREWFSGRRLFLQDLNTMFAEVLEHKKTLTDLEGRIQAEKEEWCREKLKNIGLISATDRPDAVQRLLNDKEKPLEQLITELITTLSKDAGDSEKAFEDFMQKLETAPSSDVRTEAYAETFFQTKRDPNSAASCNDYADMVRNGKSMSDTITLMVRERQAQGIKKAEKQSLLRRRDELTRAKAANAAAVAKKAKARQDRARAAAAAAQEYDLPPCENCKKAVDPQNLSFCDFCVTLADVYGFSDSSPTYFCSTECWEDGILLHYKKAGHECAGGDGFRVTNDIESENTSTPGYCKECVKDHKVESFFCCLTCFDENFQAHREYVHMPKRDKDGEIIEDEKDLEYNPDDASQYRARRIEDHWIPVKDAVHQWIQRLGATGIPANFPGVPIPMTAI